MDVTATDVSDGVDPADPVDSDGIPTRDAIGGIEPSAAADGPTVNVIEEGLIHSYGYPTTGCRDCSIPRILTLLLRVW